MATKNNKIGISKTIALLLCSCLGLIFSLSMRQNDLTALAAEQTTVEVPSVPTADYTFTIIKQGENFEALCNEELIVAPNDTLTGLVANIDTTVGTGKIIKLIFQGADINTPLDNGNDYLDLTNSGTYIIEGSLTSELNDSNYGTIYLRNSNTITLYITEGTIIRNTSTVRSAALSANGRNFKIHVMGGILIGNAGCGLEAVSGEFNIWNGEISSTSHYGCSITGGTLNIYGGTISASAIHAIYDNGGAKINISEIDPINNPTVISNNASLPVINGRIQGSGPGKYTITGGTIKNGRTGNSVIRLPYSSTSGGVTLTLGETDYTADSSNYDFTLSAPGTYTYDGLTKEPTVTLSQIPASDYTAAYQNNINAGDAIAKAILSGEHGAAVFATNFTINKSNSTPAKPAAPTVKGIPTDTSITLNTILNAKYSIDNGVTWQESPTFTGLTPNTEYTFIAKIESDNYTNSSVNSDVSLPIKTDKFIPTAPAAPTVNGTPTTTSITLNTIADAEYSIDNGTTWQDSPTFLGLTPNTEYTFVARIKATSDTNPSANSVSVNIRTDKTTATAPAAPIVSGTPTATSITLTTIAGAEYSKDNGTTWQESPTFTGLTPNTEYTFVARIKATSDVHASANSASIKIKTDKSTPNAPATPTVNGTPTTTSITLNTIAGAEYSKDNGVTWQDSPTFTGLTPNTEYTFVARIKATSDNYISANSASVKIRTDKTTATAPAAPSVNGNPTSTSITLTTIAGAEYSKDNGVTWQDSPTFTGLTPNTEYTFVARIKATADVYASLNSVSTKIKTDKTTSTAPAAPTVNGNPTTTSITLTTIAGAEYSKDNGTTWQDSPTFTGLTPNTEYTFVARIKATSDVYASVNSVSTKIKTDKTTATAPAAPVVSGTPTATSITLNTIAGAEYSKDNGVTWQDSPIFTGLTPNTEYTFIARIKATADVYASVNSVSTKIRTDKTTATAPAAPTVNGNPTTTSITLNAISGAEYSKDNGVTWQDSPIFTGLTPNTEYTFIARIKATADVYASVNSASTKIKTDKSTPNAPSAPTVNGTPGKDSITVEVIAGAEYSIDGGITWQDSPTFTGLTSNTEYTIIARIKATNTTYASTVSAALTISTAKAGLSGGAIAGIVIGSVVVTSLSGFSVFWFIIKKKKFADLIAVFNKNSKA